jgi:hypothetical protein
MKNGVMKNGIEIGNSEDVLSTKQDQWILEEAMAIYSGNNELICSKMSMKNGTENGDSGEGMWDKTDLWIVEEVMAIYSGKVIISAYLCSGKDRALSIQKAE